MIELLKLEENQEIKKDLENSIENINNKIEDLEVSLLLKDRVLIHY